MQNRTGFLRNSVVSLRPKKNDKLPEGRVLVTAPYAAIQELGGTVRPTRSRFLRIPIGAGLTRAGVSRWNMVNTGRGWTTDDGDPTFIRQGPGGSPIIFRVTGKGKGGGIEPIAVLKRSVRIPARLGFFSTWKRLERWRQIRFQFAIDRAVRRKK